jgi:HEAT repeat protein
MTEPPGLPENDKQASGVQIGGVEGGIHDSVIAGRDIHIHKGSEVEDLRTYLAQAVAEYEVRMYQHLIPSDAPPVDPYKSLYAFDIDDADIFFGRDAAIEALHETVLKDRLTVLHAKSGAGKTSLLNAGLAPRLIRERQLPVYARAYADPVLAVKRALAPHSLGPWPELLPKLSLHEFLGLACDCLSRRTQELVVVLDQFEEFFIFWPERDHRQPFIDDLVDCYEDMSLLVRFVLSLRKDYYSDLADFQGRMPTIFYNQYRLTPLSRQEAQLAITEPVARLEPPVTYEQALLDVLLDDLAYGTSTLGAPQEIEPPQLQIICSRLYDALPEGEKTITLAAYEQLERAEGILSGYLNAKLGELSTRQRSVAEAILIELVSSEATKHILSAGDLAARTRAKEKVLERVLLKLVHARLLHRTEETGQATYEIAHEVLIQEIERWIKPQDLELKRAEELLAREVASWRANPEILIPPNRLEYLHPFRARLRVLDEETAACVLLSALAANHAIEDWAQVIGDGGEEILLAALDDPEEQVRRCALRGLGILWELPEVSGLGSQDVAERVAAAEMVGDLLDWRVVKPLIAALHDEERKVREEAARGLGQGGTKDATNALLEALGHEDSFTRRAAVEALGELGDPQVVDALLPALQEENSFVRRAAAKALGQLGDRRALDPLVDALGDRNPNVRRFAAEALGELGEQEAVEPLMAALQEKNSYVRREAARALGKLGNWHAVDRLIDALADEVSYVRRMAARALGELGDPRAVEALVDTLQDETAYVRREAADALGPLEDPRAIEPTIAALEDRDASVRQTAARTLGRLGDPWAVQPLANALKDEDVQVQRAAAAALNEIGTADALAAVQEYEARGARA